MSRGFTKARMILVTKVLIANKSFLEEFVSNSTLPFPGEIGTVHKSRDKYIFYIYRNLMEILLVSLLTLILRLVLTNLFQFSSGAANLFLKT